MKTTKWLPLLCLILGQIICICKADVEPDPELEMYLREAVENFREQMKNGIPAIKMPILDPLQLQNLDINVEENLATLQLHIKKLNVTNLSLFNLTYLAADLEELYLSLNLTLPQIRIQGLYLTDGKLLKIFPIYGEGSLEVNATHVTIHGTSKLDFTNGTLQMSFLRLDLYWDTLSVDLENFLGGSNFGQVLQRVAAGVGKDVFLVYKPLILEQLETYLQDEINEQLDQPVVRDIIKDYFPKQLMS